MKKKLTNYSFAPPKELTRLCRIMKLSTIILLLSVLTVSANSRLNAQKINLNLDNVTVLDVFEAIEAQSDYRFFYQNEQIDLNRRVSLHSQNWEVNKILDHLFSTNEVNYRIFEDNLIVLVSQKYVNKKNQITVTGVIATEKGEKLPGVNIVVKGSNLGTISDVNGRYSIDVPDKNAVLIFSFLGYKTQEIAVNGRSQIDVIMQVSSEELDEVVVVGYGTMRKSDLTGAVVSVGEDELKTKITSSLDQALQGRAAGVLVTNNSGQPGGGVSIRIRGASSINSDNEPLYVIDGVPISGAADETAMGFNWAGGGSGQTAISALATINPNDIVSIEVLKDASATAIYGSRAANGVILITTKRGKAGKAKVSYEGYTGIQEVGKMLNVMNLREYAQYSNDLFDELNRESRIEFSDVSILGNGTNWQKELFRNAGMQSHQLSISGGTKNTNYSISAGYFQQDGIIIGSDFDRYSFRLNVDNKTRKWLRVGNSFTLSRTNEKITLTDSDDGVVSLALQMPPDVALKNPDGSWAGTTDNPEGIKFDNPVAKAMERDLRVIRTRALGNIYAELIFTDYLKLRSEFGGDVQFTNNYGFVPTYEWGNSINTINQSRRQVNSNLFWMIKNYLTFDKKFGEYHKLTAMVGHEAQASNWEWITAGRQNFTTNDIQELDAGDALTAINAGGAGSSSIASFFSRVNYNFGDRYLITATIRADGSSKFATENQWGYFPSFAAKWKVSNEEFMKNIPTISNLGLRYGYGATGNQNIDNYLYGSGIYFFPSNLGSVGNMNNIPNPDLQWETTIQQNIGIDLGVLDNRIILNAEYYIKNTKDALMMLSLPLYMGSEGTGHINPPWVNIGEIENKGYELSLTSRNLVGQFKWTTDINFSHNQNKVIKLGDNIAPIESKVQWVNVVTKTAEGHPIGMFYGYDVEDIFMSAEEIALHAMQGKGKINKDNGTWLGDYQFRDVDPGNKADTWNIVGYTGEIVDGKLVEGTMQYTGDTNDTLQLKNVSVIDSDDRTFIGNPNPKFVFGINNRFEYKNFDLTIYLHGVYGNKIFNFTRSRTEAMNLLYRNQLNTVTDRTKIEKIDAEGSYEDPANWEVTNVNMDLPRAVPGDPNDNTRMSSRYIEDGSYLRISNVALGYTVPRVITNRLNISNLRLYMNIQNLYTFTKYSGLDPEVGAYNQNVLLTGVDNGRYPAPRIYTLGLNIEF